MRIYNPVKQGYDQDPQGRFVREYLSELAELPDSFIHEPWRWDRADCLAYPPPIVDNASAARAAREALSAIRKSAGHREGAQKIVVKHGSRKSGVPMSGQKRKQVKAPRPTSASEKEKSMQMAFDL